jgi:hypothetical protein
MEEEFNGWYDEEHIPERLAPYLATYELDSAAVLQSPAYLARYQNPTPWSKRCLGKTAAFKRWACHQVEPGDADPDPAARALVFTTEEAKLAGTLQWRRFVADSGESTFLYELATADQSLAYRLYEP